MLTAARDRLAATLVATGAKIVFAESCTAGLCSATMAQVDGISAHLCGSAVTYTPELKQAWLGVPADTIEQHTCESQAVANAMALGVLTRCEQAQWSAAVVGHLASDEQCRAYVAVAQRGERGSMIVNYMLDRALIEATREQRQREAAVLVLEALSDSILSSKAL